MLQHVARTEHAGFEIPSKRSPGVEPVPPLVAQQFEVISRQKLFGWDGSEIEYTAPASPEILRRQQGIRTTLGKVYTTYSPLLYGLALSMILPVYWCVANERRIQWLLVTLLLALHVLTRLSAFSFLAAADGIIPVRLIRPAYPFALGLAALVVCLGVTQLLNKVRPTKTASLISVFIAASLLFIKQRFGPTKSG
jgi:hypothetical protein